MTNDVPAPPTDPPIHRRIQPMVDLFNTIITSLKALDEGYSSKNYVRKFLRALHPKWRAKVTAIEELKDLSSLALDELIDNLKVHEVVMEKDSEIYRGKKARVKNFKKFFRRKGKFVRQPREEKKSFRQRDDKKGKSGRKCFRCSDPNHLIGDCPKPPRNKDQKAFIIGSWSDNKNDAKDRTNDETCLMAQSSNEVCLRTCLESDEWIKDSGHSKHMTEVYVAQPPGFIDFQKPNYVYKLKKALYGLKQAPKAWYDRLKAFLIKHEYSMGMVDNILFTKKSKSHLIIVQIYVDDIIFGSTSQNLCDDFAKIMHDEFEMSMIRELNFFLGLQIKQMEDGIFFNQSKYIKEMLKKFGLEDSKPTKTPMSTEIKLTKDDEADSVDSSKYRENPKTTHLEAVKRIFRYIRGTSHLGLWYPKGTGIETIVYVDSDHAGDYVDRKSTSGVCTFMGCCLTSWFAKKQTALAISTTEAEYVSAGKACQQALWMKQALIDYGIRLDDVPIMCDNKGAIDLSKNPVQHSRTKHIEIRHHFLRDNVQKGNISIEKVASEDNIADIFTKPLKREVFNYLRLGLEMMELIMNSDSSSSQK
ncbi:retrovirus-related pol polyprotein from transposon TNT 1-94 [Tanacetum coccineum]